MLGYIMYVIPWKYLCNVGLVENNVLDINMLKHVLKDILDNILMVCVLKDKKGICLFLNKHVEIPKYLEYKKVKKCKNVEKVLFV